MSTPTANAHISQTIALDLTDWQAAASTLAQHDDSDAELFDYLNQAMHGQAPFYQADDQAPFYTQIVSEPQHKEA